MVQIFSVMNLTRCSGQGGAGAEIGNRGGSVIPRLR